MPIEIRPVTADELPEYFEALSASFLERFDAVRLAAEVGPLWDLGRTWGAFEGGRSVGTYRSWATEITVPGGDRLPAGAVTVVSVLPTHRRRGILRAMMATDHAASRERGEAMALLFAAEYPIYGRFGYGVGTRHATWTLDTRTTSFVGDRSGSIELVKPDDHIATTLAEVHETWRIGHAGEIRRPSHRWGYDVGLIESAWGGRWKGYLALHRDASGVTDGYVRYTAEQKWEQSQPRGVVTVNELIGLTDDAYAALWSFLSSIEWAASAKAEGRPLGEHLPWLLTNARAAAISDVVDGLWVRLFDIPLALSSRTYECEARIVLEVVDAEAAGGRVRVELDASGGGGTCRVTEASPDLTLHVSALGAAYLGGTRLTDAVVAHGVDEHRPGALREVDALFRTFDAPWCSTFF